MCSSAGGPRSPSASQLQETQRARGAGRADGGRGAGLPGGGAGAVAAAARRGGPVGPRDRGRAGAPGDGPHAVQRALRSRSWPPTAGRSRASTPRSSWSRRTSARTSGRWPRWPPAASCRGSCSRCTPSASRPTQAWSGDDGAVPERTLIFDEVDAGIGGAVADAVGERLRALGDRFQVILHHAPAGDRGPGRHPLRGREADGARAGRRRARVWSRATSGWRRSAGCWPGASAARPFGRRREELLDTAAATGESQRDGKRRKRKSQRTA